MSESFGLRYFKVQQNSTSRLNFT